MQEENKKPEKVHELPEEAHKPKGGKKPKKEKKSLVKKIKTLVLLDAHALIHRAYHALPEFLSTKGEPTGALYGLTSMIMKIITELKPEYIVACYDLPEKTFRHEAYKEYKGGRKKTDEALILQLIESRKIFESFNIPSYDAPRFEADDILGTIVEKYKKEKNIKIIIASGDMDTMQLVDNEKVQVYTLKKGINDTILYSEEKVKERFGFAPKFLPDYKGLRGDPSDNIIGIKGIGEKTATDLIKNFGTIETIYKEIKAKKGEERFKALGFSERIIKLLKEGEEEALFSKTLAKIRKDAPIEFKLPEKTFKENIEIKKIEEIFERFEFRSLFTRLKTFLVENGNANTNTDANRNANGKETENKKKQNENDKNEDRNENQNKNQNKTENEKKEKGLEEKNETQNDKNNNEEKEKTKEEEKNEILKLPNNIAIMFWLLNSNITNPKQEEVFRYTKTRSLEEAQSVLIEKLRQENLLKVYEEIEEPIIQVVNKMKEYGITLDKACFEKLSKEYHREIDKLTEKIYKMAGEEFNINSPKQLGEILFNKMGLKSKKKNTKGSFSTKISVLEELEEEHEIIKEIMKHRELAKLLSTYIDPMPSMVEEDGRLHAEFIQYGTTTGRFSSKNPNLQNIPIKTEQGKKIRNGFVTKDGWKLVAFDYSQIELRVAGMLSGDKKMTKIFKEGKDIHKGVASFVFGVNIDEVTSEMRRKAKIINFGIIYGMGISALKKNLGGTREEAQKFYDNYFRQFDGLERYLEKSKELAMTNHYSLTLFGRKRFLPDVASRIPFIKAFALRTAINAPIQGTSADIIKLAIRYAEEDLKKAHLSDDVHLVLQIHDELVFEVKENVLKKAEEIIKNSMETVLFRSYLKYQTEIPLIANSSFGDNLGELK